MCRHQLQGGAAAPRRRQRRRPCERHPAHLVLRVLLRLPRHGHSLVAIHGATRPVPSPGAAEQREWQWQGCVCGAGARPGGNRAAPTHCWWSFRKGWLQILGLARVAAGLVFRLPARALGQRRRSSPHAHRAVNRPTQARLTSESSPSSGFGGAASGARCVACWSVLSAIRVVQTRQGVATGLWQSAATAAWTFMPLGGGQLAAAALLVHTAASVEHEHTAAGLASHPRLTGRQGTESLGSLGARSAAAAPCPWPSMSSAGPSSSYECAATNMIAGSAGFGPGAAGHALNWTRHG